MTKGKAAAPERVPVLREGERVGSDLPAGAAWQALRRMRKDDVAAPMSTPADLN